VTLTHREGAFEEPIEAHLLANCWLQGDPAKDVDKSKLGLCCSLVSSEFSDRGGRSRLAVLNLESTIRGTIELSKPEPTGMWRSSRFAKESSPPLVKSDLILAMG